MMRLRVLLDELDTLVDVAGKVLQADVEELLLMVGDLADGVDLLDTVGAELHVGRKVLDALVLVERRVDESGLDDVLLPLSGLEEGLGEAGTSHGHREGGRTGTVLGLDDFVTTKLDAVDVLVELLASEVVARLGEEGNDGSAGVATDNGDVLVGRVGVLDLGDEAGGADDVEGGDTEKALGVVDTLGLEDLGGDGDGRVDLHLMLTRHFTFCDPSTYRVGDDEDVGLGGVVGGGLGQVADDGGVGVEQVWANVSRSTCEHTVVVIPSRVMPGLRGTPAGMRTISEPLRASARPVGVGSYPRTFWRLAL